MMRKLAGALVTIGALGADLSYGVGIGDTHIESTLNQPLKAAIHLADLGEFTPDEIAVSLAGSEEFIRAGVDRQFFLSDLRFTVKQTAEAKAYIEVSTDRPIKEPFVNFLLEVRWPEGQMLREFTFLLDPPNYASQLANNLNVPLRDASKMDLSDRQIQEPAAGEVTGSDAERVRVGKYDTLWSIARKYRPDSRITIKQAMLAIQDANPHAFPTRNINDLEIGSVVVIPPADAMRRRTSREAAQEVRRQNIAWVRLRQQQEQQNQNRNQTAEPVVDKPRKQAAEAETKPAPARSGEGSAKESQAKKPVTAEVPQPSAAALEQIHELEQALNQSRSAVAEAEQERDAIMSRLDQLQQHMMRLQQLVEIKDSQLDGMERQLAEQSQLLRRQMQERRGATDTQVAPDYNYAAQDVDGIKGETQSGDVEQAETVVSAASPEPPEPLAAESPTPKPQPQPELEAAWQPILAEIMRNPLLYGGAASGGLALLLALLMMRRRRQETQAAAEERRDVAQAAPISSNDESLLESEAVLNELDEQDLPDADLELPDTLEELEPSEAPQMSASETPLEPEANVKTDTTVAASHHDPLGEADIYIAYGRYEQAAGLLQRAIADAPERAELRLKLLEVLVELEDEATFNHQEQELKALGHASALAQAAELRERLAARTGIEAAEPVPDAQPDSTPGDSGSDIEEINTDELDNIDRFDLGELADETAIPVDDDADAVLDLDSLGDFDLSDIELESIDTKPEQGDNTAQQPDEPDVDLDALDLTDFGFAEEDDHAPSSEPAHASEPENPQNDTDELYELVSQWQELEDLNAQKDEPAAAETARADADDLDKEFEALLADAHGEETSAGDVDAGRRDPAADSGSSQQADAQEANVELDLSDFEDLDGALEIEGELPDLDSFSLDDLDDTLDAAEETLDANDGPSTQLDLARAYVDMGDKDGAKVALQEVLAKGDEQQQQEARQMLEKLEA